MTRIRMHADEVFTDVAVVRRLLAAEFPRWDTPQASRNLEAFAASP